MKRCHRAPCPCCVESLEPRVMFSAAPLAADEPAESLLDLQAEIVKVKMPEAAVAGDGTKVMAKVAIVNEGEDRVERRQKIDIQLFARPVGEAGAGEDVLLTTRQNQSISNLRPGKSKSAMLKATLPNDLAQGEFVLVAVIDTADAVAETDETNNEALTDDTVEVAEGYYDLACTLRTVLLPDSITEGSKGKGIVRATVTNAGNLGIPRGTRMEVRVVLSPVGGGEDIILRTTDSAAFSSLKPGKSRNVNLPVKLLSDLAEGDYDLSVIVDAADELGEPDETNNAATETAATTVASAADFLAGTWEVRNVQGAPIRLDGDNCTWNFYNNGTYDVFFVAQPYYPYMEDAGNWSLSGSTLEVDGWLIPGELLGGDTSVNLTFGRNTFSFRDSDGDRWVFRKA